MAIFNLGSVNVDHFYKVPHLPAPGETLSAISHRVGLGGKGMNQSVAAVKAGAEVYHIGAIGQNVPWVREQIEGFGVNCQYLREVDADTGHAVVYVDAEGENSIVIHPGANMKQDSEFVIKAIDAAAPTDTLILQNETNLQTHAATFALVKGMRVIYSAAPFSVDAVKGLAPELSLLVMNALEADQLCQAMGIGLDQIPTPQVMVTLGAKGAMWRSNETGEVIEVASPKVTPIDTTGAGDTYIGYFAACLDLGMSIKDAMERAVQAAALKVTRYGTAEAIPSADEVNAMFAK